ncbi:hypothetical protein HY967_04175 [Candidatus Jorgensenbacteria bacterium]|nr:hypothetical protein [Candidatus Jorgensenbacteria bacterium]
MKEYAESETGSRREREGDPLQIKLEMERELSELAPELEVLDEDIRETKQALEQNERELAEHKNSNNDKVLRDSVRGLSDSIAQAKISLNQLESYRLRLVALIKVYTNLNLQVDTMMADKEKESESRSFS